MTQSRLPEIDNPVTRVYALNHRDTTEEEIAVTFAMTSRNPEAFDTIARQVTATRAEEFNEKWVLGYGHASVAEHAVLHIAVENFSRLAVDRLEDNRLGSYTEKSSRYQPIIPGNFHTPAELAGKPQLITAFKEAANRLMQSYETITARCITHLKTKTHKNPGESERAFTSRLNRIAMDSSRGLLPAATTTNVGITANARTMEHAISKLLSAPLEEERELGQKLKQEALKICPSLVKYAEASDYLRRDLNRPVQMTIGAPARNKNKGPAARVIQDDRDAEERLAAAYLFHRHNTSYQQARNTAQALGEEERAELVASYLKRMGPHDPGPRELEQIHFTLELAMDYGALREFRRHRIQSLLPQQPSISLGRTMPDLIEEAEAAEDFDEALETAAKAHQRIAEYWPPAAAYLVTHTHIQRMITTVNLRECYHLLRLRTSPRAHASIRGPIKEAMARMARLHPSLFPEELAGEPT